MPQQKIIKSAVITLHSRVKSFGYAIAGFVQLGRQEPNARIHIVAGITVTTLGLIRGLTAMQWVALIFAMGFVLMAEAFNTAIEMLCNLVCDNKYHPVVKVVKDISAAAVLIAAATSVIIALLIFI